MSEEFVPLRKNPRKTALGRGLGSLLGEANVHSDGSDFQRVETVKSKPLPATNEVSSPAAVPAGDRIWRVAIEKITPNKEQPRKLFDPEKLRELATSIKEKGILLPIIVRPLGTDRFEVIAGERRWRAAQQAGLQEVPIIIRTTENREALELALIENIQRQDINPIEEAEAYELLSTKYGLTQQQIAEKVSKERSTVANLLRLMALAPEVKELMKRGELQLGQAKVLLAVEEPKTQIALAKKVVKQKLSVRATERLVVRLKTEPIADLEIEDQNVPRAQVQALVSEMQKILGTKVDLDVTGQRSRVAIQFYSMAELNQFIDKLRKIQR